MTADDLNRIRLAKASIGVLMTANEEFAFELRRVLDKYLPLPDGVTLADFADEPPAWDEREVQ